MTALFSLVNAALLRALPVREPDRLVLLTLPSRDRFAGNNVSIATFQQIRGRNTVLEGFAGVRGLPITLFADAEADRVEGQLVSGNYFETLGVNAVIGRVFTVEDDPVSVISYGFWMRRFGGDPNVIGRTIRINSQPLTVVGVTPKAFNGLDSVGQTDIWVPLAAPGMAPYRNVLQTFGRLKPSVSLAQAQISLDALYRQIETRSTAKVVLQPGGRGSWALRSQYERPLGLLLAAVGLVLLIACANITNLLMARASNRSKEIAVRLALGASRARLVRQLLAESTLLTLSGAVLGIALAYWMDRTLVAMAPAQMGSRALIVDVSPDWRVLLFTLGVAMLVSMLSGIGPAIHGTSLKGKAPRRVSFANGLVVVQVALSLILLIGAGLFLRSLHNLKSVDPGFDPSRLIVLTMAPEGYSPSANANLFDAVVERVRNLPGVMAASPGLISPLSSEFSLAAIKAPGYLAQPNEPPFIAVNWVGPEYFKALGTPLVTGRAFTEQDGRTSKVALVNERTAAHFWPRENPIGKHVIVGGRDPDDCEIIGVVKDVKSESLREPPQPTVYMPFRQNRRPHLTLHVRVAGDTAVAIPTLIREIRALDRNVPPFNVTTMAMQLDRTIAQDRLLAALTVLFGLLAVVLAAVGLYGVMAFSVTARTREIGIRMVLGADRSRVLGQIARESAVLTAIGIALGVPGALWASGWVSSFLYGLSATDPSTYIVLALALAAVAMVAAWIPARRAARVEPAVALRSE